MGLSIRRFWYGGAGKDGYGKGRLGDLLCDEGRKISYTSSAPKTSTLALEMVVGDKSHPGATTQPLYVPSLHTRSSALRPYD